MPLDLRIELDSAEATRLSEKLERLPRSLQEMLRLEVRGGLNTMVRWMVNERLTGGTTATRLARRSGRLIRSIKTQVVIGGFYSQEKDLVARVYVDPNSPAAVYAPVHEFGATIRPRQAQYLTIPLTDEARKRKTARRMPGLFVIKSKKGNLLLVRRVGESIFPQWLLRKEVTIPSRPAWRPAAAKFFPIITEKIQRRVQQLVALRGKGTVPRG